MDGMAATSPLAIGAGLRQSPETRNRLQPRQPLTRRGHRAGKREQRPLSCATGTQRPLPHTSHKHIPPLSCAAGGQGPLTGRRPLCSAAGTQRPLTHTSHKHTAKRQELHPTGPGSYRGRGVAVRGLSGGGPSAPQGQGQEEASDLEVAVFRFSLGLPFLDDKYVPRAAGLVLGTLLLLNHWLSTSGLARAVSPAQQVSEVVGVVLAVLLIVVPAVDTRLQELKGGRRAAGAGKKQPEAGPAQRKLFLLAPSLPSPSAQELAWASFTLLRNTNTASLLLLSGNSVIFARGVWALPAPLLAKTSSTAGSTAGSAPQRPKDTGEELQALEQQLAPVLRQSPELQRMIGAPAAPPQSGAAAMGASISPPSLEQVYIPSLSGAPAWAASLASLSQGTASLLIQPLRFQSRPADAAPSPSGNGTGVSGDGTGLVDSGQGSGGVLVLLSDLPRAFSARDRAWVSAIALKLSSLRLTQ